ncbi:MAG TPA: alpha/beta fold hydrolase, partial [Cystobacter sp.]
SRRAVPREGEMKKTSRWMGAWMALLLALALPVTALAKGPRDVKVERREFPVRLANGQRYTVVGYLYYQGSLKNRPVQILTHGITYNHGYWDLPEINRQDYSYARYMARQHFAVLALDLLGTGESDKPQGDFIDLSESASSLHQVVQRLKATAARNTFEKILYVGHSNGALTITYAQAYYRDAQAVVLTGWLNTYHQLPVGDEVFGPLLEQGPYVQIPPALRSGLFYYPPAADPAVIAYDNTHADFVPRGQLSDLFTLLKNPEPIPSEKITVPIMVQLGEFDAVAPAAYAAQEAQAYPRSPLVFVDTIDDLGHATNGHHNRLRSWTMIALWLRSVS